MRLLTSISSLVLLVTMSGCTAEVSRSEASHEPGMGGEAAAGASSMGETAMGEATETAPSSKVISVSGWTNTSESPTLAALRGKPVVVEFWATWCPPCVKSTPHLVKTAEQYADRGLVVLGIHSSRGAGESGKIAAFVERFKMPYAIGLDTAGATGKAWGVTGIPKAFVFDRAGAEIWSGHPAHEEFDRAVERAVGSAK
ncbi:MAG: TlpA disulfide reductase family protein [Planctomycetota bacterium]|nr:TlpA disulfide reductase family protein [Planctomycetota bacterium]